MQWIRGLDQKHVIVIRPLVRSATAQGGRIPVPNGRGMKGGRRVKGGRGGGRAVSNPKKIRRRGTRSAQGWHKVGTRSSWCFESRGAFRRFALRRFAFRRFTFLVP